MSGRIGENILRECVRFAVPGGQFRDWSTLDYLGPVSRTLTVFDGHRARKVARYRDGHAEFEDIRGSPGVARRSASGPAVAILAAYLTGRTLPAGTALQVSRTRGGVLLRARATGASYRMLITRPAGAPAPGLFRLPVGRPALAKTEPDLNAASTIATSPPFWLAVSVDGRDESLMPRP